MIDRKIICKSVPETVASRPRGRPTPRLCLWYSDIWEPGYVYICHHSAYRRLFARRTYYGIVAATWVVGLALDVPCHAGWSAHTFDRKTQKCLWVAAGDAEARGYLPSCRSVSGTAPCRTTTLCSTSRSACCCRSSSLSCATVCLFVCLSVTYMHTYIHTYKLI